MAQDHWLQSTLHVRGMSIRSSEKLWSLATLFSISFSVIQGQPVLGRDGNQSACSHLCHLHFQPREIAANLTEGHMNLPELWSLKYEWKHNRNVLWNLVRILSYALWDIQHENVRVSSIHERRVFSPLSLLKLCPDTPLHNFQRHCGHVPWLWVVQSGANRLTPRLQPWCLFAYILSFIATQSLVVAGHPLYLEW